MIPPSGGLARLVKPALPVLLAWLAPGLWQQARAGAWTMEESAGQVILQSSIVSSSRSFGPKSDLYSSRSFDKVEVNLVFEYGLKDWLTLIAAPQFLYVHLGAPDSATYSGPGYTDLGARVRLWQDESRVFSAQSVVRLSGTGGSGSAAAVGNENTELDLRLLAGFSFDLFGRASYLDIAVAERLRFGDPPDEFRLDATLGVRTAPRWQLLFQSFNVISQGAGKGPYFNRSYEYYKMQVGAAWDFTPAITLQGSVVSTVFARNAPLENGMVLSALYKF